MVIGEWLDPVKYQQLLEEKQHKLIKCNWHCGNHWIYLWLYPWEATASTKSRRLFKGLDSFLNVSVMTESKIWASQKQFMEIIEIQWFGCPVYFWLAHWQQSNQTSKSDQAVVFFWISFRSDEGAFRYFVALYTCRLNRKQTYLYPISLCVCMSVSVYDCGLINSSSSINWILNRQKLSLSR